MSSPGTKRIGEAVHILRILGFPQQQQNERSGLTLLALLGLGPGDPWSGASNPLMGITKMMEFFDRNYGKRYAPNSRETVRKHTVHQFLLASLVVENPDDPKRPTNSGKTVYQLSPEAVELLKSYGSESWARMLSEYMKMHPALVELYSSRRKMTKIPLTIRGQRLGFSPGGQSILVQKILEEFVTRFVHGGVLLLAGDTAGGSGYEDSEELGRLDVQLEKHGKRPDVIIHDTRKNRLVVIEAVTSHEPMDPKRKIEMSSIFSGSIPDIVYVTAFMDKRSMSRHMENISWGTKVWVADSPDHMIHFNGLEFPDPFD